MKTTIEIKKAITLKSDPSKMEMLQFGKSFSPHMFSVDYINGVWVNGNIDAFGPISVSPSSLGLHYGQSVFEGMKAFRMKDGKISIFRIQKHYERFCKSLQRMCMPAPSFDLFSEALKTLVSLNAESIPDCEGSLYIRPFMFASEERFGVNISNEYKFIIFTGPVGEYYNKPLKVKVEDKFIRASKGGTGSAKCSGNYGGAFYPTLLAKEAGYDQVIWTDLTEEMNIEESGTMNIMFVINGGVVTPALSDTTLDGVTRDSFVYLAKDLGYKVEERKISALELIDAFNNSALQEAFGVGTAAVATPIELIHIKGADYSLPKFSNDSFINKAKELLNNIRTGSVADKYTWNTVV